MAKQHQKKEFSENFDPKWIRDPNGFEPKTIAFAEKFGKHLVQERLTTAQIRNIFGEVKRISADPAGNKKSFLLLKPKIAYAAKRAGTRGIMDFKKIMDQAHTAVLEANNYEKAFQNFSDFFEAILAYHKAFGGRE